MAGLNYLLRFFAYFSNIIVSNNIIYREEFVKLLTDLFERVINKLFEYYFYKKYDEIDLVQIRELSASIALMARGM